MGSSVGRFRSFVRLSRDDRRSLVVAIGAVTSARLLLWALPYRLLTAVLERSASRATTGRDPWDAQAVGRRIGADVARAAHLVPGATCLVQALAAQWLITRSGASSALRFGVAKGAMGVEAHVWLESGGQVVLGGDHRDRFTALT